MRKLLKHIMCALVITWICKFSFAQVDTFYVSAIRNYISYIDSINKIGHLQSLGFLTAVEDGIISRDNEIVGGFGVYTLLNLKEDTAYRIEYNGGVDITTNKTYYYKSNQLVFARLELRDRKGKFYQKEEFYKNGNVLFSNVKSSRKARNYPDETNLSLFDDGLKYLDDFKKFNSRR